jgi:outer membrane protein W
MKKIAWAVFFLVVFSSTVYAADAPKFGIGVRVGHNFYQDGSMDVAGAVPPRIDYSNKSTWMYGINGTLKVNEYFSIELALDRTTPSQCDLKMAGLSADAGDGTQTPLTLAARFHWPIGIVSPYIGGGVGYYWNSFDKNNDFWNPAATVSMDNSVGYFVNIGSEFFLDATKNIALNLDFKYVWNKADLTVTMAGVSEKASMKLDSFVAGIGIKYYF